MLKRWLSPNSKKRFIFFLVADILLSALTLYLSYLLRFNFTIPSSFLNNFWLIYFTLMPIKVTALALMGQYKIVWRYYGSGDTLHLLEAHILAYGIFVVVLYLFYHTFAPFARSIFIIDFFLSFLTLGGLRAFKRLILGLFSPQGSKPTLIIGLEGGSTLIKAIKSIEPSYKLIAIVIFKDSDLVGSTVENLKVYPFKELESLIDKYKIDSVIVAEELNKNALNNLIDKLEKKGIKEIKRLRLSGESDKKIENIPIEELLARKPKDLDKSLIASFLKGKSVLITGAGGSIGSEITRQCLSFGAKELILIENSEYNLYKITEELSSSNITPYLCSVLDRKKLEKIFKKHRPQIVIHAAAFKHVPLCELNPDSAVENNIVGSMNVIDLSIAYRAKKVVNISSDKAVRPTNIMGATKRVVELYAQNIPSKDTEIVSVRFGNVLGSSGSVVPKFKAQIEKGGPVTVTHPKITRYFMLIPEACQLVLQASAIAKGKELFILDMGEPIKIVDLAKKMIRLYGKEDKIKIAFTGLRPGEKLYEELLIDDAECKTKYNSIYVAKATKYQIDKLREDIKELLESEDKRAYLKKIVPEYKVQKSNKGA